MYVCMHVCCIIIIVFVTDINNIPLTSLHVWMGLGVLIGSKGAIIHDMQAKTNCKMFVKQEGIPDGLPRELIITGLPDKIPQAKALAMAVMDQGPVGLGTSITGQPLVNHEMDCSPALVGRVIGAQGATIKDLQVKSGAKIHVNQDFPEGMPRKVLIAGTQDCVNNAVRMVQIVMEQGMYAYICIYMRIHTHTYILIHTYIHTYMLRSSRSG